MRRIFVKLLVATAALTATLFVVSGLKLSMYRITTSSMAPDYPVGSIVITSGVFGPALHWPLTFTADGGTITHVLVGYNSDGSLMTRGIANNANDHWRSPVYIHDVYGRVLFRLLLFAPSFWTSWQGMVALIGVGFITAALLLRRRIIR